MLQSFVPPGLLPGQQQTVCVLRLNVLEHIQYIATLQHYNRLQQKLQHGFEMLVSIAL